MNNSKPWENYPLIANELEEVNDFIQKTIKTPHKSLQAALLQMADNGGKYLRPSLLLLAAHAVGKTNERTIKLASSIEILHMATLIHDDIIDDSDERRGNVSIQAAFGKDVAVYTGDLLFTDFFDLMLDAIDEHEYLVRNAQTMRKILWILSKKITWLRKSMFSHRTELSARCQKTLGRLILHMKSIPKLVKKRSVPR